MQYGELNLVNVAGYLAGSTVAGRLSRRVAPPALVRAGTIVALAGGVAMVALAAAGIVNAWSILGPVVALTFGFGIVLPAATAAALDRHPTEAGLASALLGFIQISAAAAGTAAAGAVLGQGTLPLAFVFLLLTALAAALRRPPLMTIEATGGTVHWFTVDGLRLRAAHWPNGPKGTVLLLNGRTDYIERFAEPVAEWQRRGYAVWMLDWRGPGRFRTPHRRPPAQPRQPLRPTTSPTPRACSTSSSTRRRAACC